MLEIENIQPVNKGSVLAKCDVHIVPWKMRLHDITIFEKGVQRWIALPAKQYEKNGETIYKPMVSFDTPDMLNRFRNQIMEAVDAYLVKNPDLTPEPVIRITDDLPF